MSVERQHVKKENKRYENEIKRECNDRKYLPVEWAGAVAEGNSFRPAACAGNVCIESDTNHYDWSGFRIKRKRVGDFTAECHVCCGYCHTDPAVPGLESRCKTSYRYGSKFYLCNNLKLCGRHLWIPDNDRSSVGRRCLRRCPWSVRKILEAVYHTGGFGIHSYCNRILPVYGRGPFFRRWLYR